METIVELFRDSLAFKIITGILMFLFTNLTTLNNSIDSDQIEKETLEITFDQKFLDMSSVYNDHYLTF